MQPTEIKNFEYAVSIRVSFPEAISKIIKQEKDRFVSEYGSKYKSEPHITLYLTRYALNRNTKEGFSKLILDLQELSLKPFEVSLLNPKVIVEKDRHRNLYVVDVSNKEQLEEWREQVYGVAARYRSTLLSEEDRERGKELEPHITVGEINFDDSQAEIADVQSNLKQIVGEKVTISSIVVFFYMKEPNEGKAKLIEEATVQFQS